MATQVQTAPFMLTRRSSAPPAPLARYRARRNVCQFAFALVMGGILMLFTAELGAVRLGAPLPFSVPAFPAFR